jgi:hypothetical protein
LIFVLVCSTVLCIYGEIYINNYGINKIFTLSVLLGIALIAIILILLLLFLFDDRKNNKYLIYKSIFREHINHYIRKRSFQKIDDISNLYCKASFEKDVYYIDNNLILKTGNIHKFDGFKYEGISVKVSPCKKNQLYSVLFLKCILDERIREFIYIPLWSIIVCLIILFKIINIIYT